MENETPNRGGSEASPRPPSLTDLARLCRELNRLGARYVVGGGVAMIQAGYFRTTDVIDLLIETTPENEAKVIEGLLILPDKAAAGNESKPGGSETDEHQTPSPRRLRMTACSRGRPRTKISQMVQAFLLNGPLLVVIYYYDNRSHVRKGSDCGAEGGAR